MRTAAEILLAKKECRETFKVTPGEDENSIFELMFNNVVHGNFVESGGFYRDRQNAVKEAKEKIKKSEKTYSFFYPSIIVHQLKDISL